MNGTSSIRNFSGRRRWAVLVGVISVLWMIGGCCDECDDPYYVECPDDYPPAAPTGVYSITGDEQVEIHWNANTEPDLEGYDIFWASSDGGPFQYMVSVSRHMTSYLDTDVRNQVTYYYRLRAYDRSGQVSEFSATIFDTPRPEGTGLMLYSASGQNNGESGYDFSERAVQAWALATTDVYFASPDGVPTLFGKGLGVGDGVDVQDYGYVDMVWVDWAPDITEGWSPSKRVEMIPGHSYVVQILNDSDYYSYAKVYCQTVNTDLVVLDWAYQEVEGNPELSPERGGK